MTIDKAIEILTIWKRGNCPPPLADEFNALQLGIEALKAWDKFREGRWVSGRYDLPGETER